jgi:hypothetical protein
VSKKPAELLERFRKNKRNHGVGEWLSLLEGMGWTITPASKEGYKCKRGTRTLILPNPHGGDKVLKLTYATRILREIDLAELEAKGPEMEGSNDE